MLWKSNKQAYLCYASFVTAPNQTVARLSLPVTAIWAKAVFLFIYTNNKGLIAARI